MFTPDGRLVVSAGWDAYFRLWDASSGSARFIIRAKNSADCIRFTPDGQALLSVVGSEIIRSKTEFRAPNEDESRHLERLLAQIDDESVALRDAASKELVSIGFPAEAALEQAAKSQSAEVRLRARRALKAIKTPEAEVVYEDADDELEALAISPDGTFVAAGSKSGSVVILSLADKAVIATLNAGALPATR